MYCQKISFVCFAAMGVVLVLASAATAQSPIAGAALDLRADVGVVLDTGTGRVATWEDQSGNGSHFTATAGNQPGHVASNGPAGKPALTFGLHEDTEGDSVEDYLLGPDFWTFSDWTIFAAVQAKTENKANGGDIIADYGGGWHNRAGLGLSTGSGWPDNTGVGFNAMARSNANEDVQPNFTFTAAGGDNSEGLLEILTGRLDSTAGTVSVYSASGGLLDSVTDSQYKATNTAGDHEPVIGTNSGFLNGGIRGYVHELIIYPTALNDSDRSAVEGYLAAKYIPEPSTWVLLSLGVLTLVSRRRRAHRC